MTKEIGSNRKSNSESPRLHLFRSAGARSTEYPQDYSCFMHLFQFAAAIQWHEIAGCLAEENIIKTTIGVFSKKYI